MATSRPSMPTDDITRYARGVFVPQGPMSAWQHVRRGLRHLRARRYFLARINFRWAMVRLAHWVRVG